MCCRSFFFFMRVRVAWYQTSMLALHPIKRALTRHEWVDSSMHSIAGISLSVYKHIFLYVAHALIHMWIIGHVCMHVCYLLIIYLTSLSRTLLLARALFATRHFRVDWLMIAFITCNCNVVPFLQVVRSSNPCRSEFLIFCDFLLESNRRPRDR